MTGGWREAGGSLTVIRCSQEGFEFNHLKKNCKVAHVHTQLEVEGSEFEHYYPIQFSQSNNAYKMLRIVTIQ